MRSPAPAKTPLTGAGAVLRGTGFSPELRFPVIVFPPVAECWPELGADSHAVLPRTNARRRWKRLALACSGEGKPHRSWCSPPVKGLSPELRFPIIVSPPVSECWPELGAYSDAVLRRTNARRRWEHPALACSGEGGPRSKTGGGALFSGEGSLTGVAVPGNSPSSCGQMLAGAECGHGCCPPANQRSSEEGTSCARLLRRRDCSSELVLSSGERALTGVAVPGIDCPPGSECWPELDARAEAVLRRTNARQR